MFEAITSIKISGAPLLIRCTAVYEKQIIQRIPMLWLLFVIVKLWGMCLEGSQLLVHCFCKGLELFIAGLLEADVIQWISLKVA